MRKAKEILQKKDLASLVYNKTSKLFKTDVILLELPHTETESNISSDSLLSARETLVTEINEYFYQITDISKRDNLGVISEITHVHGLIFQYDTLFFNKKDYRTKLRDANTSIEPNNQADLHVTVIIQADILPHKNLFSLQEEIETELEKLSQNIQAKYMDIQEDEKLIYTISVAYSILLSIFLSIFTASKISRPFKVLTEIMDSSHDFKVNKERIHQLDKSSNEVKILVASFENLLDEISNQLEVIREKSEILEGQNQKLQVSEKNLEESNKVKDKFFSILAHDLRGPFATIQSFLEILINHSEAFTKEEITKLAQEMSLSIDGLFVLLENLLEWSRSQMGYIDYAPSEINITEVINKNIQIINIRALDKKIKITSRVEEDVFAFADYNMVDFVLRNLLSNAVKFTPFYGEVCIECKEFQGNLEIAIIDNGTGLSWEDQQKLFRKDVQFSKIGTSLERGTGLGLLLCKEFVEKCSGSISVDSVKGEGATFKFYLPLQNENKASEINNWI